MTCGLPLGFACAPDAHDGFFLLPQKQAKNAREKAAGAQKDLLLHRYRSGRVAPGYHSSCRPHSRSTLIVDPASQAGQFLLLKQPTGFIDC